MDRWYLGMWLKEIEDNQVNCLILRAIIANCLWILWKSRNEARIDNIKTNSSAFCHKALAYKAVHAKKFISEDNGELCQISFRWVKPNKGWLKLNTDGSWYGSNNEEGTGFVIRDALGNYLIAGGRYIAEGDGETCKVLAVLKGIQVAIK